MTGELGHLARSYREHGYAVLRGAIAIDLVERVRARSFAAWDRATGDPSHEERFFFRQDASGTRVADRIEPFLDLDPGLAEFAGRPEVQDPTVALIGGPLWVLKDKLIRKLPGTDGYGVHQDHAYYAATGIPAERLVSVLVPLSDADDDSGPLEVAPGSHTHLRTGPGGLDPDPAALAVSRWETVDAGPGDLAFLHPLTLHRSAPNRSAVDRPIAFVTYGSGPGGVDAARTMRDFYRSGAKATVDAGGSGLLGSAPVPPPDPPPPPPA